jgi:hypothetical protein
LVAAATASGARSSAATGVSKGVDIEVTCAGLTCSAFSSGVELGETGHHQHPNPIAARRMTADVRDASFTRSS